MLRWALQVSVCYLLLVICGGDIRAGAALNIFPSFGDLGTIVRVNPHHDPHWFSNNDSVDVFEEVLETRSSSQSVNDADFNGNFNLELCDNLVQLKQAIFRPYRVEGCQEPWRAFAGGWTITALARHLGLNTSHVVGEHGYALVRLVRTRQLVRVTPRTGLRLNNWTAERMALVVPGLESSVLDFIRTSGSHFVTSYTTGDALYQVFVFLPSVYAELQTVLRESRGQEELLSYFTPWRTEYIGKIRSLSGNKSVERWVSQRLRSRIFLFLYTSLLVLRSHPQLLQQLDQLLGNDALLSAELTSLAPLFTDPRQRRWFEEVLYNQMSVWEQNI